MTVTTSGAITFSNIMNEFNSGGGQSNIRLGDYTARYPDNFGGVQTIDIVVAWDGSRFTFDGFGPSTLFSFRAIPGKCRICFRLNSSVNVPFYVATTQNTTGSNLASGVSNNGATYSATGGAYNSGTGSTFVFVDVATAAGGTSEVDLANFNNSKCFFLNTNTQQTSGGADVGFRILSQPDTGRFVTRNLPFVDFTLNASWSGGSEAVKNNQSITTSDYGTIIPNGASIQMRRTMDVFPIGGQTGGFAPYVYSPTLYPVTYTGTGYAQGINIGTGGYLYNRPWPGSGNNYISGGPNSAGGRPNTGQGWADYMRIGDQAWEGGTSGLNAGQWGYSATNSGATAFLTLTNNTGQDYAVLGYSNSTMGQRIPWNMDGYDVNSNQIFLNSISYGSNSQMEIYEQNAAYIIRFGAKQNDGTDLGDPSFSVYDNPNSNRSDAITNIGEVFNDLGFGGSSTFPGVNIGSGNGLIYFNYDAYPNYPSTGTIRIRRVSSFSVYGVAGGKYEAPSADVLSSVFVGRFAAPAPGRGCSNITGTSSYSTGTTVVAEGNGEVSLSKFNVKLSDFYGTRNLGSDGG